MNHLHIHPHESSDPWHAVAYLQQQRWPCVVGRSGTIPAAQKREGDQCTPEGQFILHSLMWRMDRRTLPPCHLPSRPIERYHGWCDDPRSEHYNRLIDARQFPKNCEHLWRKDHLYDFLIITGHNDSQRRRIRGGSAIFVHMTHPSIQPTLGCVAFSQKDLSSIIPLLNASTHLVIHPARS